MAMAPMVKESKAMSARMAGYTTSPAARIIIARSMCHSGFSQSVRHERQVIDPLKDDSPNKREKSAISS
jgi:hypothetical protein